jgi:hypothetical protein
MHYQHPDLEIVRTALNQTKRIVLETERVREKLVARSMTQATRR